MGQGDDRRGYWHAAIPLQRACELVDVEGIARSEGVELAKPLGIGDVSEKELDELFHTGALERGNRQPSDRVPVLCSKTFRLTAILSRAHCWRSFTELVLTFLYLLPFLEKDAVPISLYPPSIPRRCPNYPGNIA